MGEITDKAQGFADRAHKHILGAIRDLELLEKLVCKAGDNDAAIAVGELIIATRKVKNMGMKADGQFFGGVQVKSGST